MSLSPFDFLRSINETKEDLMVDEASEKAYNSFIVNRSLSYFPDTVLFANEMNRFPHISNRAKCQFLINTVRKRKRFSKWAKNSISEDLEIVKEYYGYSNEKARSALTILSSHQLQEIKSRLFKGGLAKQHPSANRRSDRVEPSNDA